MFGANKPAFGGFGTSAGGGSSLFGSTAPKPVGVAFGTQQPAQQSTGGLFGGSTAAGGSLFGSAPIQTASSNMFGTASPSSAFGQPPATPSSNLFGSNATSAAPTFGTSSSSLFNKAPAASSMFGSTQQTQGLFGATQGAQSGTAVKFDAPTAQDTMMKNSVQQSINIKHQCITAMKQYETKSLEELRVEDYLVNRKGPQSGAAPQQPAATGLFGAATSTPASTSLFGAATQNKPLFGASAAPASTSAGLFGGAPASTGGLFGLAGTATASKNLFGAPTTTTNSTGFTFGGNTGASAASGGLFGANTAPKPAFGAAQPATGMFGATAAPQQTQGAFSFGATAQPQQQPSGGLFGAAKPAGVGLFGATSTAPAAGFSFNTPTAATGFGASTSAGTGLFGAKPAAPTSAFGGFGATPAFGATTTSAGGLFGATPKPGLFSTPAQGQGLFGAAAPKPAGQFSFGAAPPPAQSGFSFGGAAQPMMGQPVALGTDAATAATQQLVFEQQMRALGACPYGDTPLMKMLHNSQEKAKCAPTDPAAQRRALAQIEQKQKAPVMSTGSPYLRSALNSGLGSCGLTRRLSMPRSSPKILMAVNRSASFRKAESRESSFIDDIDGDDALINKGFVPKKNPKKLIIRPKTALSDTSVLLPSPQNTPSVVSQGRTLTQISGVRHEQTSLPPPLNLDATHEITMPHKDHATPIQQSCSDILNESDDPRIASPPPQMMSPLSHPAGIILRREGYYTMPSMSELARITNNGTCIVSHGFTVGRNGYGSVFWAGETDVTGLNLDALVHFRLKEVTVYPDDNEKPAVGQGLNKPAEVTLEKVWPLSKSDRTPIKDYHRLEAMRFRDRMELASARMDAVFLDYRPESGSWVFKVPHFTKYGLDEIEDTDLDMEITGMDATNVLVQRAQINLSPLKDKNMIIATHNAEDWLADKGLGGNDVTSPLQIDQESPPMGFYDNEDTGPWENAANNSRIQHKLKQLKSSLFSATKPKRVKGKEHDSILGQFTSLLDRSLQHKQSSSMFEEEILTSEVEEMTQQMNLPVHMQYSERLMHDKSRWMADNSLFHNIRFKPAITETLLTCTPSSDLSKLSVMMIDTDSPESGELQELVEVYMKLQLEHSEMIPMPEESSCPKWSPQNNLTLLETLSLCDKLPDFHCRVWKLCSELWANNEFISMTEDKPYAREMVRKEGVKEWFIDTTNSHLEKALTQNMTDDLLAASVIYMKHSRLTEASQLALKANHPRLSLCIISAFNADSRQMLHQQLMMWKKSGQDQFININTLTLYVMCAGQLEWTSSQGVYIRILDDTGVKWETAFLYHMNLVCGVHESLCDLVTAYDRSVQKKLAPFASPDYCDAGNHTKVHVCYQLLQLYANKSHALESLLDPSSHICSLFDYLLSWHLWSVLSSIGYAHLSLSAVALLHVQYSAQLVRGGAYKWAATVILHIDNQFARQASMQNLLHGHVHKMHEDHMQFIVDRLNVPNAMLARAKLIIARCLGNKEEEALFALEAGDFNVAHEIIVHDVAPELVVNDKLDCLEPILTQLERESERVRDWAIGGQVYIKYIQLQHYAQDDMSADQVKQNIMPVIMALITGLQALHRDTPIHILAHAEMSNVMLNIAQRILGPEDLVSLGSAFNELCLPEDYTLDYCSLLTESHRLGSV